jgi:rfaE bifunctional protein nucleotidyltransferase chain/domain
MASEKIKSLDELAPIIRALQAEGKTIVHCHGVFDLLHLGHIRHFEAARRQGDILVVTVTQDEYVGKGPGRPVFNQRLRAESIAALQVVDYVAINEWPTAVETIRALQPDVYAKGSDYADRKSDLTGKIYEEEQAVLEAGGSIYFTDDISFSSTKLLNSYFGVLSEEAEAYLRAFRQSYTSNTVIELLKKLRTMRVLVVGDVIVDEYHFCDVLGKSSKSHVLNARFLQAEAYAGGILAVANHVAGFCEDVHLVTCLGERDPWHDFIINHLRPNISTKFFLRPDAPTTVKRRFLDTFRYTNLFEVSFLSERPLPQGLEHEVVTYLKRMASSYDLVLVADFGHGLIGPGIVEVLSKEAGYLSVNAQTNSANTGYNLITKYPRVDYVCVHEDELRLANHDRFGPLEDLIERTALALHASTLVATRGHHGSTAYQQGKGIVTVPVFSTKVVDPLGAGDAYMAVTAPCAAAGYPAELIGFIGNCVGALAVLILGNKEPVEPGALYRFIATLLK